MNIIYKPFYLFLCVYLFGCVEKIPEDLKYIDSNKPKLKPQKFASGFISKVDEYEFGSVFSKDGKSFYYAEDSNGKAEIRQTKFEQGKWTTPEVILAHPSFGFNDPFLSPDESRLYYISNKPINAQDTIDDIDIWYSEWQDSLWSKPINAGNVINSLRNEYYISFTKEGTMYFASNKAAEPDRKHDFDIYTSTYLNGTFQEPQKLSGAINTRRYEADVFIDPAETYIIFCSARRDGLGSGDLYISFKNQYGQWSEAKHLGPEINSEKNELCPFVTHDGKYFFYTSNQDIYWVSTAFFDQFRGD